MTRVGLAKEKNPNWKGGKPHCIVCGKELAHYSASRCFDCYRNKWKDREIDLLKAEFPNTGTNIIAKTLKRSKGAIAQKASELGLKANRMWSFYDNWEFYHVNPYIDILSEQQIAYIAGLFDGEGWISEQRGNWQVGIGLTHKPTIHWLLERIPYSKVYTYKNPKHNWKRTWQWKLLANAKVLALLELLQPYLIVKKERANEVIGKLRLMRESCNTKKP